MTVGPTLQEDEASRRRFARFLEWTRRVGLERKLAIGLLIAAVASVVATLGALTGNLPVEADAWDILWLLNLNLILLLCLAPLVIRRLAIIWMARRRGIAGARLHIRLVALFSLVAVTPTIIVALVSVVMFDFVLEGWFSKEVSTAIEESQAVTQAYLKEHQDTIAVDLDYIARNLNNEGAILLTRPQGFNRFLSKLAWDRSVTEALVFEAPFRILARTALTMSMELDPEIPDWAYETARSGQIVVLVPEAEDRVRALVRLDTFPSETFLYVGRLIDPTVLAHVDETEEAAQVYANLQNKSDDLQISFAMVFAVVALLLLLAAVWVGLAFANQLSVPIRSLIGAADRVTSGDLSARAAYADEQDEMGSLATSFNRMTDELSRQQNELIEANQQLDVRRRFIEAVLAGVSSGILGLDRRGKITLPNRRVCDLLGATPEDLQDKSLAKVLPELAELLQAARKRPRRIIEGQVQRLDGDGRPMTLFVRIAPEVGERGLIGFVVTIDDITELLSAQRKAAWSDVARRIAHEIKNPLTPIQLSAERLKRKYLSQIDSDSETFQTCTDTIIRHVGDIGRMVDEFSSFARMPAPEMKDEDLGKLVEEAVFLQSGAHPTIDFTIDRAAVPVVVSCDAQQIRRVLTNLLQNSVDSIEGRLSEAGGDKSSGKISVVLREDEAKSEIVVEDNGRGLPEQERHRLTEPYITTREKGTGLGLAIVKKIMEDHEGHLILEDAPGGGARVTVVFPRQDESATGDAKTTPQKDKAVTLHGA
ncbi:MAG: PAS domain-containing sensor histidine kinase [Pseudomonadota bacterium]